MGTRKRNTRREHAAADSALPPDAARFISERKAALAHLSDAEIEEITQGSIRKVDAETAAQIVADARALREQLKTRGATGVRRHQDR